MIGDKFKFSLWMFFVLLQLYLFYQVIIQHNYRFIIVQSFITFILLVIYLARDRLRLNNISYILILMGFSLHFVGSVFKYYYNSPFGIAYDHITHPIIIAGFTILFFNFLKEYFTKNKAHNTLLFIVILFTVNGAGVLSEISEYGAYAIYGLKDGALLFGGADYDRIIVTEEVISEMEMHGGGWYDTMDDLVVNLYTSILVLTICYIIYKIKGKSSED